MGAAVAFFALSLSAAIVAASGRPAALRHAGIEIVAIHNHMSGEDPRIAFLHYWGIGGAEDLARGVRAALEKSGGTPGSP